MYFGSVVEPVEMFCKLTFIVGIETAVSDASVATLVDEAT